MPYGIRDEVWAKLPADDRAAIAATAQGQSPPPVGGYVPTPATPAPPPNLTGGHGRTAQTGNYPVATRVMTPTRAPVGKAADSRSLASWTRATREAQVGPLLHGPGSDIRDRPRYTLPFALETPFEGVDQGVDYVPTHAVRAIASGRVHHVSPPRSFGGGTGEAVYVHLDHPIEINGRTYYNVYYAERRPLVRVGKHVRAGQPVMAGGSNELGFASRDLRDPRPQGPLVVVPATATHGRYTKPTIEGQDFLSLLRRIASGTK